LIGDSVGLNLVGLSRLAHAKFGLNSASSQQVRHGLVAKD
jgi:hypothetical protein